MTDIEVLYQQQIRQLPVQARLQLLVLIAQDLAALDFERQHRLTELKGLGREIWQGIDAQEYVDQLRREWDERP
jgi:hypothetical protein